MDSLKLDLDVVVDGKPLREWLKSDEGLVDYDRLECGRNVSNTESFTYNERMNLYGDKR